MFDRRFYRNLKQWVGSLAKLRRAIVFVATILLPGTVALVGAAKGASDNWGVVLTSIQICALIFSMLLGGLLFYFNEDSLFLFHKLAHEQQRADDLEDASGRLGREVTQLSAQSACVSVAVRAIEALVFETGPAEEYRLELSKKLVEVLVNHRNALFGIADLERWNFALYLEEGGILTAKFCIRNFGSGNSGHRSWPVGQGHVGLTYQRGNELQEVVELVDADVSNNTAFRANGDLFRANDGTNYRGVASVCIPNGANGDGNVGVLIATSSEIGRFTDSNIQPIRDMAQSIGVILARPTQVTMG